MVKVLLILAFPFLAGWSVIMGVVAWIWSTETAGDAVVYLTDATAALFAIAALNGLIAWAAERKGRQGLRGIFVGAMHNTAGVGIACLLTLAIVYILI